jgi:hypothetical protein
VSLTPLYYDLFSVPLELPGYGSRVEGGFPGFPGFNYIIFSKSLKRSDNSKVLYDINLDLYMCIHDLRIDIKVKV